MKSIITRRYIIGTRRIVFTAWEPQHPQHSTVMHIDGKPYGRVGTLGLYLCTAKYPYGTRERITLLNQHRESQYEKAYKEIFNEYPDLEHKNISKGMGYIELTEEVAS